MRQAQKPSTRPSRDRNHDNMKTAGHKLFVGGLPHNVTEEELRLVFLGCSQPVQQPGVQLLDPHDRRFDTYGVVQPATEQLLM